MANNLSNLGIDLTKLTPTQQTYMNLLANKPSEEELYSKYSKEYGIPEKTKLISGLTKSILDLEGKIKGVEPSVNARTKDFFVNEAARQRAVTAEELPLREQYLETMRRREGAQAELSGAQSLLGRRLGFASEYYQQPLDYLSKYMEFEKSGSGVGGYDFTAPDTQEEQKPSWNPNEVNKWDTIYNEVVGTGQGVKSSAESVFKGISDWWNNPERETVTFDLKRGLLTPFKVEKVKDVKSSKGKTSSW